MLRKDAIASNRKKTPIPQNTVHTIVFWIRYSLGTSGLIRFAIPNNKKKPQKYSETIIIRAFFRFEVFIIGNFINSNFD